MSMPSKESGVLRLEQMEEVAKLFSSCVLMCQMDCSKYLGKEIAGLQGNEHRVCSLAVSSEGKSRSSRSAEDSVF
jgi:hypothetical protein